MLPGERPTLRVVATDRPPAHEFALSAGGRDLVVEVITFAEWDRLTRAERPTRCHVVPGIGFAAVRHVFRDEALDVQARCDEALDAFRRSLERD